MPTIIVAERPNTPDARTLIAELEAHLSPLYPSESRHGFSVEKLLRLETGIHQSEAIGLYERMGFRRIPPFGAYHEDPLSRFYEKQIGELNTDR